MSEESKEELSQEIREFEIGEAIGKQKARVTQLQHPAYGTTYLIDITSQVDPTTQNPYDKTSHGKTVAEMLEGKLGNPANSDHYALNNGVLALITDKLDSEGRRRLYMGIELVDMQDSEQKEITSHILDSAGFQQGSFYVPFSFDSALARSHVGQEIVNATKDSPDPELFDGFQKQLN